MAGDEPKQMLTAFTKVYTHTEVVKEVKRQQKLPYDQQSKWVDSKTKNRVYFTGF